MTTRTTKNRHVGGARVLLRSAAATAVLGAAGAVAAASTTGRPGLLGVLVGTALVLAVLGGGALAVDLVARVLPAASLLVALLTYTLQVVVMALFFVAFSRSGLLDDEVSREWLAAAVIAGTLIWVVAQVVVTTRLRIPAYALPVDSSEQAPERVTHPAQGGER